MVEVVIGDTRLSDRDQWSNRTPAHVEPEPDGRAWLLKYDELLVEGELPQVQQVLETQMWLLVPNSFLLLVVRPGAPFVAFLFPVAMPGAPRT